MSRSLEEHATRRGQIAPAAVDGQKYNWQHRIASLVHGWGLHEHHYADSPLMLSDDDYDTALALAASGSTEQHPPAVARAPVANVEPVTLESDEANGSDVVDGAARAETLDDEDVSEAESEVV